MVGVGLWRTHNFGPLGNGRNWKNNSGEALYDYLTPNFPKRAQAIYDMRDGDGKGKTIDWQRAMLKSLSGLECELRDEKQCE